MTTENKLTFAFAAVLTLSASACSTLPRHEGRRVASTNDEISETRYLECTPVISETKQMAEMKISAEVDRANMRIKGAIANSRVYQSDNRSYTVPGGMVFFSGELLQDSDDHSVDANLKIMGDSPMMQVSVRTNYPDFSTLTLRNGQVYLMSCLIK